MVRRFRYLLNRLYIDWAASRLLNSKSTGYDEFIEELTEKVFVLFVKCCLFLLMVVTFVGIVF